MLIYELVDIVDEIFDTSKGSAADCLLRNNVTRFSIKLKLQSIPKLGLSPTLFPNR